ncbi:38889_t:CDS:2, partial [Gigaspora margarita]
MNYYLIAFVTFISYILYKCYIYPLYLSPLRKIPGPPLDSLIFGHYATLLNKELDKVTTRLTKQYGGIVRYYGLFNKPNLLISDPELIQTILVNHSYDYPKHFINNTFSKEFMGDGIFLAKGDSHKRQRKMMQSSFTFTNIKEMVPTFVQAGHKLKDIWMKQIGNKKEERITITELTSEIALDVIGLVGFNYEFNSTTSGSELAQAYKTIVNRNPSFLYRAFEAFFPFIRKLQIPYYNQYNNSIKIIKNVSERLVGEQKDATVRGKDLLSLLIKANENLPIDEQLTHNELLSQVMTLLIAGHETTSVALSWTLYFIAKNADVQNRLRKEILEIFTDRNHFPTFDEIEQLKYLECGTPITIAFHVFHHDPSIWGDDAEYFNPSRWLDPEIKSKVTNTNFLPFGAGPRNCLGMKMTQLELKSILSIIIRNFEFRLVEGFTFKKKNIGMAKPIPGIDLL